MGFFIYSAFLTFFLHCVKADASRWPVANTKALDVAKTQFWSADGICNNIPPGFDRLRLGVDITVLDLLPGNVQQDLGFRSALFDFTCNKGATWDYISNGTTTKYQLPDQIGSAYVVSRQYLNYAGSNFLSYHDYKDVLTSAAKLDKNFTLGAFVSSPSYMTMQDAQQKLQNYATYAQTLASSVVGQMQPYWFIDMSAAARQFIDTVLPDAYDDDPRAYETLIKTYGTHYVSQGEFGGIFSGRYLYSKDYRVTAGDEEVEKNVRNSFNLLLATHGAQVYPNETIVDPKFTAASKYQVVYYGGDSSLIDANKFKAWWDSVRSAPWLVSAELNPIWQLVHNNTRKQESVRRATLSYVDAAYLKDKQRSLETFVRRSAQSQDYARALQKDVTNLIQAAEEDLLKHAQVVAVGQNVTTFLHPLTSVEDVIAHSTVHAQIDWNGKWPFTVGAGENIPDACGQTYMQFSIDFPASATDPEILKAIQMQHTYQLQTSPQLILNISRAANGQLTPRLNHCRIPEYDVQGHVIGQAVSWSLQMLADVPGYLANVQLCVNATYNNPPFVGRQVVNSCVYPNQETTPVTIEFVWSNRTPSMTWSMQLKFGDLGPY